MGLFDRLFRRRRSQDVGTNQDPGLIPTFPLAGSQHSDDRSGERGDDPRESGSIDPSSQQIEVGDSGAPDSGGGGDYGGGDSGGGGGDSGGGGGGE